MKLAPLHLSAAPTRRCLKLRRELAVAALLLAAGSLSARAQMAQLLPNPPGGTDRTDFAGNVATQFTIGAEPVTVSDLLFYDAGGSTLQDTHTVSIFLGTSTTPIATATFSAGDGATPNGSYLEHSLTIPVVLAPDTTYVISTNLPLDGGYQFGSGATNDAFQNLNETGNSFAGEFEALYAYASQGTGGMSRTTAINPAAGDGTDYTVASAGSGAYAGGSFVGTVPEPSTGLMSVLILAGALVFPWCRRRRTSGA